MNNSKDNDRQRCFAEQCWLGVGLMLFWAVAIMTIFATCARGADVKFTWNANPETDIAGYILLGGTTVGGWTITQATGNVTTYTLPGLEVGRLYFFSLKAVNTAGMESDECLPIMVVPKLPPEVITLTIQQSNDLRAWAELHTLTVPVDEAAKFFRIKIETAQP